MFSLLWLQRGLELAGGRDARCPFGFLAGFVQTANATSQDVSLGGCTRYKNQTLQIASTLGNICALHELTASCSSCGFGSTRSAAEAGNTLQDLSHPFPGGEGFQKPWGAFMTSDNSSTLFSCPFLQPGKQKLIFAAAFMAQRGNWSGVSGLYSSTGSAGWDVISLGVITVCWWDRNLVMFCKEMIADNSILWGFTLSSITELLQGEEVFFTPGKKECSFYCVYLEKVRVMCRKVHEDIQNVMFSSHQVCDLLLGVCARG